MDKKKIRERLPKPQPNKEQKADGTSVSPAIAKPNVVCSQSELDKTLNSNSPSYLFIETEIGIVNLSNIGHLIIHLKIDGVSCPMQIPTDEFSRQIMKMIDEYIATADSTAYLQK